MRLNFFFFFFAVREWEWGTGMGNGIQGQFINDEETHHY